MGIVRGNMLFLPSGLACFLDQAIYLPGLSAKLVHPVQGEESAVSLDSWNPLAFVSFRMQRLTDNVGFDDV